MCLIDSSSNDTEIGCHVIIMNTVEQGYSWSDTVHSKFSSRTSVSINFIDTWKRYVCYTLRVHFSMASALTKYCVGNLIPLVKFLWPDSVVMIHHTSESILATLQLTAICESLFQHKFFCYINCKLVLVWAATTACGAS